MIVIVLSFSVREVISNELHKQVGRNFPTCNIQLKGLNVLYQADLVEMIPYVNLNKGNKYILTNDKLF